MAKPTTSRTYSTLHFEDLEPHRFEDMVRQLILDYRDWIDIQAPGRSGSDQGVDIRAIERVGWPLADVEEVDESYLIDAADAERREWIFQCKRYSRITPKQLATIAKEDLAQQTVPPYAYVVVASCDFSAAARDAFRKVMVEEGITEFYLWGKAELEDRLYMSKNDHLLFAYFGISLQVKKRSQRTQLRANLALKKKLAVTLGPVDEQHFSNVLIRDPSSPEYPEFDPIPSVPAMLPWNYWPFLMHGVRNSLIFEVARVPVYVNWETKEWDPFDPLFRFSSNFHNLFPFDDYEKIPETWRNNNHISNSYNDLVPEENRATLIYSGHIFYDRILLFDELGDVLNSGPHLLIDYLPGRHLAEKVFGTSWHQYIEQGFGFDRRSIAANEDKQIEFFPESDG